MSRLLIIKTGHTLDTVNTQHGDFEHWFQRGTGFQAEETQVIAVYQGEALPTLSDEIAGIIVTGSSAMVSERAAWSENTAAWLREAIPAQYPILGVCYGHQLIAHALGGAVDYNPRGYEAGSIQVTLTPEAANDILFNSFQETLSAYSVHAQTVLQLPTEAVVLANNARDSHQAFRVGNCCWGLQFHPEFNQHIMSLYIEARHDILVKHGYQVEQLLAQVKDCSISSQVLQKFGALVRARQ